ncbi:hypothetical protein [Carp edema virus]|nr:hypothetical protein [Carp edema virus]
MKLVQLDSPKYSDHPLDVRNLKQIQIWKEDVYKFDDLFLYDSTIFNRVNYPKKLIMFDYNFIKKILNDSLLNDRLNPTDKNLFYSSILWNKFIEQQDD